jgi:hypothetical protein
LRSYKLDRELLLQQCTARRCAFSIRRGREVDRRWASVAQ